MKPKFKNDGRGVVFGPVRLSYVHLLEKYSHDGDPKSAKYSVTILIKKSDTATADAVRRAIEAATKAGVVSKWGGKAPRSLADPLRDGDEKEGDEFQGCWYLNAKCNTRPHVVDLDCSPIVDEEEVYSGMWANVSVTFFPFDTSGNRGVACGLNNVQKVRDGERLGGRTSAESDFGGVSHDDEEDL